MSDISQWCGILGVSPTDSAKTIKAAYRELAQLWHPDRYMDDPELKARAEEEIKEINQAYQEIKTYLANKISSVAQRKPTQHPSKSVSRVTTKRQTPEFFYHEGVAFAEQRKYDEALASFAQAVKLNPNYLEAYQYRGHILAQQGFSLRADAEFKKAHRIKLQNRTRNFGRDRYVERDSSPEVQSPPKTTMQTSLPLQNWQTIVPLETISGTLVLPGNNIAAIVGSSKIQFWQGKTSRLTDNLSADSQGLNCLALSPSGHTLISAGQIIKFWDLRTRKLLRTLKGGFDRHLAAINTIAVSSDNQILLSCDRDNALKIWNINQGRIIKNISFSADVTCLEISPNGKLFCSGGLESQIRIRQLPDGQVIRSLNNGSGVLAIAFSRDGKLLATGGFHREIKIWNLNTGQEVYRFVGHQDRISKLIFSQDQQTLISASWDKTIRLWSLAQNREIFMVKAHQAPVRAMAISFDQATLMSSTTQEIKLWKYQF